MIFRFANPEWLWLLLLVPLLFWILGRQGNRPSLRFPSVGLVGQISALVRSRPGRYQNALRWFAFLFLILALARPQTGERSEKIEASGLDIVIALDLSTSMWAHDFEESGVPQDRLTVVKSVVKEFIRDRANDRIGLVAFAAEPYLVSPITLNHDWLLQRMEDLSIGMIEDGTAIGSAIGASANRLRDIPAESRIIILVTDGASNRGQIEPVPAAEAATAYDIKIYTIGVGREGVVPYPARFNPDGSPTTRSSGVPYFRRAESEIDLETLQEIADKTDARYYHATALDELEDIYSEIDELEKTEIEYNVTRIYSEAFMWPLIVGIFLLIIDTILRLTRFRRIP